MNYLGMFVVSALMTPKSFFGGANGITCTCSIFREPVRTCHSIQGKVWLSGLPQTLQTFLDRRGFPRPRFP